MSGDFNWGADSGDVVLRAYGSIAVHENPFGDVVVRQERDALDDDDQWVVIPVQDAELIAQAIIDKAREIKAESQGQPEDQMGDGSQPRLALPAPAPRQPMNGGRQRSGASNG